MGANVEEFLEFDRATGVCDLVTDDAAGKLCDQVHEGLAVSSGKADVARAAAAFDDNGREGLDFEAVGAADGVDVDFVGA